MNKLARRDGETLYQWTNRISKKKRIHKIILDQDNRMLRFGFGKNQGRWFLRIDLWFVGFRFN